MTLPVFSHFDRKNHKKKIKIVKSWRDCTGSNTQSHVLYVHIKSVMYVVIKSEYYRFFGILNKSTISDSTH